MSTIAGPVPKVRAGFWHEALLYDGDDEFVERTAAFVDDGLRAGEPVLVLAARPKLEPLRERIGAGTTKSPDDTLGSPCIGWLTN